MSSVSCSFLTVIAAIPAIPTRHSHLCPTNDAVHFYRLPQRSHVAKPPTASNALAAQSRDDSNLDMSGHEARCSPVYCTVEVFDIPAVKMFETRHVDRLCLEPGRRVQLVISNPWGLRPETDRTGSGILGYRDVPPCSRTAIEHSVHLPLQ